MTRTGAIVIRWGPAVRGRETKALEVFGQALQYYEELAKEGKIISHHEFISLNRDGGCMVVEGLLSELLALQQDENNLRLLTKAGAITEDFTVEIMVGGSDATVQDSMMMFTEVIEELQLT